MNNIPYNHHKVQDNISLKDIFTLENLKIFFKENKSFFSDFDKNHLRNIKKSLFDFHTCRDLSYGKVVFSCPHCNLKAYRPITCKSRFCTCCGTKYAEEWALGVLDSLIDKPHRASVFTIHPDLWQLAIAKREILADLSDIINKILKPYYKFKKIISYGLIVNIHTFARDSSFNTHFHVILSEGGFNKNGKYIKNSFFPVDKIKNSWKHLVLLTFKKYFKNDPKVNKIINNIYKNNSEFFVNIEGVPLPNNLKAIQYFGRYLARPAIAEYRITEFKDNNVTFWYNDLKSKEKVFTTIPLFDFMKRLIIQIPPKNFKMVRRYGFYARRKSKLIANSIVLVRTKKNSASYRLSWEEKIKKFFGREPLVCPNCNTKMVLSEFHHYKYGSKYYYR